MKFLEYIVMFNKLKRDNDLLFMVSEDNFTEYKIGDIIIVRDFNSSNFKENVFVVIDDNNISIPISYLYYIDNDTKNIDFVYQLDDRKIIKKIGKVNGSVINEYKRKFILLNKNVNK